MLGKQLKCGYITLCKKCHFKLHAKEVKEDIYKQPLSPYGTFFYINIDEFKQNNISHSVFTKIIKLGTYMNWDNIAKGYGKRDLCDMLGIKDRTLEKYNKELKRIISINESGDIYINENYIKKGRNNYKDKIVVFIDNFNYIYDSIDIKQHKVIGEAIYNNNELEQIYYYGCSGGNSKKKFKDCIDTNIIKWNKGEIMFNPEIFLFDYLNDVAKTIDNYNIF